MSAQTAEYTARRKYLVCIDSDGTVFDTMEIKHKECFCPAFIDGWDLQPVSSLAREVWEFVNLYSKTRGCTRFHALIRSLDLLGERPEVKLRGFQMPSYEHFRHWVETAPVLSNDALIKLTGDPEMARVLRWSLDINARIKKMVHGIPPFPFVRESLEKLSKQADIAIVSGTPLEALEKEWREHQIDHFVSLFGAQEDGTKAEIIAAVKDRYAPDHVIMVGDAPGDQAAAKKNGILFFPIRPLDEIASWEEFCRDGVDRFLEGTYEGSCMQAYVDRFERCLPELPPWKAK